MAVSFFFQTCGKRFKLDRVIGIALVKAAAVKPKLMLWSMVKSVEGSIPFFFRIYSNTISGHASCLPHHDEHFFHIAQLLSRGHDSIGIVVDPCFLNQP